MLLNHGPSREESFSRARLRPFSNSALEAPLGSQGQRLGVRLPQATAGVTLSIAVRTFQNSGEYSERMHSTQNYRVPAVAGWQSRMGRAG